MKYVRRALGESAEASAGGGERGLVREIFTLLIAAAVLVTVVYFGVGLVVEWSLPMISFEREQSWFASVHVENAMIQLDEKQTTQRNHASAILAKLCENPEVPKVPFQLVVLPDREPNAFAIPGGTIAVTTGLLDLVGDDEVALAFVLGHELGHFAQRDHLRGIGRTIGRALVWSLIFGGNGGADLLAERTDQLLALGHSRQQERGADRWGVRLVMHTYGTREGSDRLFKWLANHDKTPAWLKLLSTHPAPTNRVAALREYADEFLTEKSNRQP